jgi:transposase-like protein
MLPRVEKVQGWNKRSEWAAQDVEMGSNLSSECSLPAWLPDAVRLYLDHTEQGVSLRQLARREGCHASTVMRQVRRYESRRDDPLVDEALCALGRVQEKMPCNPSRKDAEPMTAPIRKLNLTIDEATVLREGRRVLRRLAEPETVLAIAPDMEKAAVLRSCPDGRTLRLAVIDRGVAQAFALKDWISCPKPGRVSTYLITQTGRAALKRMLAQDGEGGGSGMAEAPAAFGDQHRDWAERDIDEDGEERRVRYNSAESPVQVLARRRDRDGKPFLPPELVSAAEQLRMDFELAQMGPRVTQNWERFLTGGGRGSFSPDGKTGGGPRDARERVSAALRDLGPGLGDMVLRCCCFLEGLELAEKRMGWSARSGKIVLRIALQRLRLHYDATYGKHGPMIG